jgi:hypothetical protein
LCPLQKDGKDGSSPSEGGKDKEGAKLWEGAVEELGKQIKKRPRALKQLKDGLAQVQSDCPAISDKISDS